MPTISSMNRAQLQSALSGNKRRDQTLSQTHWQTGPGTCVDISRVWSLLAYASREPAPEQAAELANKRKSALRQYVGASCIWQYCAQRGIHVTWELAERCQAWRLPLIQKLVRKYTPYFAVTHGCQVNLRDPKSSMFLHKEWKTMTTHQHMADMLNQRCRCPSGYKHAKCEGGVARGTAYYTPEFAKRVVTVLLQELNKTGLQQEIHRRSTLLSKFGEGTACVCVLYPVWKCVCGTVWCMLPRRGRP